MAKGKGGFIGYSPLLQNPVVYQGVWSLSTQYQNVSGWPVPLPTNVGVFFGSYVSSVNTTINFINLASAGNAASFGSLTTASRNNGGFGSTTRGVTGGGYDPSTTNIIEFITFATKSNTSDFGDLTVARGYPSGSSNNTRGLFSGGYGSNYSDVIDYVTIASEGNATDFGNLSIAMAHLL